MTGQESMKGLTYHDYLRLSRFLETAKPLTPARHPRVFAAEHFFIVAHQTTELWLKQILMDLDHAVANASAPERDIELAADHIARAASITRLLVEHVGVLRRLQPQDFAEFRGRLGTASGAQSVQLHRLRRALGLAGRPSPLLREFLEAVDEQGETIDSLYRHAPHSGPLYRLAEAMVELAQAFWQWQLVHIEVTTRSIGQARGTGQTSGSEYLTSRLAVPFPELWEARTRLHSQPTPTMNNHNYAPMHRPQMTDPRPMNGGNSLRKKGGAS